jgi:glucose-6-phosphate 1-epimerase
MNFMLPQAIVLQTGFGHLTDLPCIRLQHGTASAVISLYGAQLMSYQPVPEQELLWLSPLAQWHNQTPIRGGVPICWPWFGPADARVNPKHTTLSNHGLVRTRLWHIAKQQHTADGVSVTLQSRVDDVPHFAGAVTVQLRVYLADSLRISLHCDTPMLQQAALHSYFCVPDVTQTTVWPLPQQYHDKVSGQHQLAKSEIASVDTEVDRIYANAPSAIYIGKNGSQVNIVQQGQDATVVWNPWQHRSQQIFDLPDNAYRNFICVETARLQLDTAMPLHLSQQLQLAQ